MSKDRDKKDQNKTYLAIGLGVIAVGFVVYQLLFAGDLATPPPEGARQTTAAKTPQGKAPARGAARAAQRAEARLETVEVDADQLLQGIQQVQFNYAHSRTQRNPMDPLVGRVNLARAGEQAVQAAASMRDVVLMRVTGIVWDQYAPAAVVDDEVVTVGHTYENGVRVYAIEPSRVIFLVGDSLVPVELKELGR